VKSLSLAITLAANPGQRCSDVCRMTWGDIEYVEGHRGINVRQQKTGLPLWVPFTRELEAALSTKGVGYLILKPTGAPYTSKQLTDAWIKERARNPALEPHRALGLTLHGLRATAVVRLRRAGISRLLIQDFVGMSGAMVDRYCRRSEQKDNALAALRMAEVVPFNKDLKNQG